MTQTLPLCTTVLRATKPIPPVDSVESNTTPSFPCSLLCWVGYEPSGRSVDESRPEEGVGVVLQEALRRALVHGHRLLLGEPRAVQLVQLQRLWWASQSTVCGSPYVSSAAHMVIHHKRENNVLTISHFRIKGMMTLKATRMIQRIKNFLYGDQIKKLNLHSLEMHLLRIMT